MYKIEKEARQYVELGRVRQCLEKNFDLKIAQQLMTWLKEGMRR